MSRRRGACPPTCWGPTHNAGRGCTLGCARLSTQGCCRLHAAASTSPRSAPQPSALCLISSACVHSGHAACSTCTCCARRASARRQQLLSALEHERRDLRPINAASMGCSPAARTSAQRVRSRPSSATAVEMSRLSAPARNWSSSACCFCAPRPQRRRLQQLARPGRACISFAFHKRAQSSGASNAVASCRCVTYLLMMSGHGCRAAVIR